MQRGGSESPSVKWGLRRALSVHLRGRNFKGALASLGVASIVIGVGLHRQALLPFSAGIVIDLPPFTPYCYTFTAVLLASPRFYDLERQCAREVLVRVLVLTSACAALGVTGAIVAFDDVDLALVTVRNALFFFGLGLALCRFLESALAALTAGVITSLLAFLGSTPDGSIRSWAWLLLDGESLKAGLLAGAVLTLGVCLDLTRPVPVGSLYERS